MYTKRLITFALGILFSCAGILLASTPNDSIKNMMHADSVLTGNALFVKNCGRCHKLKDPAKYTMVQWPGLVNKMQKRAKITDSEKAMILSYLATGAKK